MQFIFTETEKRILNQIGDMFEKKYKLDWKPDGIVIKVKSNIKLDITMDNSVYGYYLLLSVQNNKPVKMRMDSIKEHEYLDTLEEIVENLKRQIDMFRDFMIDFVNYLDYDDIECLIDLDSCKLLLKGPHTVVIYPTFDLTSEEEHIQININDIYGNCPLTRKSSIEYKDLRNLVEFYLFN